MALQGFGFLLRTHLTVDVYSLRTWKFLPINRDTDTLDSATLGEHLGSRLSQRRVFLFLFTGYETTGNLLLICKAEMLIIYLTGMCEC